MKGKEALYKHIKTGALLSTIPFILVWNPVGGYFIGAYLKDRFDLGNYIVFISIGLGFAIGISETIKIIMLLAKDSQGK